MSKTEKKASEKERDEHQNNSVFDFLYGDNRRIGSFLGQFDDSGHLEKVIQRESATTGSRRGWKIGLGGGAAVLGTGGTGNAAFEVSPSSDGSEASERVYDPLWANARTFLDYLHGANLIQRDLSKARIGQFVLLSGTLSIFDYSVLKSTWELSFVKKMLKQVIDETDEKPAIENRSQRRSNFAKNANDKESTADSILSLLKFLPHSIICSLRFDLQSIWCSLNEAGLAGPASEIALKHGAVMNGTWTVVGILDALPDTEGNPEKEISDLISVATLGSLGQFVGAFAPAIRGMLGRPRHAYGITPLLFREISG